MGDCNLFNMNIKQKIEQIIDEDIRPHLKADGGDINLIEFDESKGIVKVSLAGHCQFCPMATMTLQNLVEKRLKAEIKEVKEVINVTIPE